MVTTRVMHCSKSRLCVPSFAVADVASAVDIVSKHPHKILESYNTYGRVCLVCLCTVQIEKYKLVTFNHGIPQQAS